MKRVWPLAEVSWTMPRIKERASARTGMTYRPSRMVMMFSWSAEPYRPPLMKLLRRSIRRLWAIRTALRSRPSSSLAVSSTSPRGPIARVRSVSSGEKLSIASA